MMVADDADEMRKVVEGEGVLMKMPLLLTASFLIETEHK